LYLKEQDLNYNLKKQMLQAQAVQQLQSLKLPELQQTIFDLQRQNEEKELIMQQVN